MTTIFIVLKSNFKRSVNNRKKLVVNLVLPVAAIIFAMIVNYVSSPSVNIGVVENASFPEGKRIISMLRETEGVNIITADNKMIKTNTILGKYDGVIILKQEFKRGEAGNINKYFDFYSTKSESINKLMAGTVMAYMAGNDGTVVEKINEKIQEGMLSKAARTISFLATILLITCVINGAMVIKDKAENTFTRFMYSPNSRLQYMTGNIIYNYIFSYTQLFLALVITYAFKMRIGLTLVVLLAYGLILVLVTTTFGTFIAAIFNKELYANLFAGAVSFIFSLVGGAFITYDKMPRGLQIISNFTPNRWIIKSVDWLEHSVKSSVNPILILSIFSFVFVIAASAANRTHRAC